MLIGPQNLERETGFEPATSSLGSWRSTTELHRSAQLATSLLSQRRRRRRQMGGFRGSLDVTLDLAGALNSYLLALRVTGHSKRTIDLYRDCVQELTDFLGNSELGGITTGDIRRFMGNLQSRLKPATVNIRFRAIRAFFNWLEAEGLLPHEENPVSRISPPRVPRQYPHVLTDLQVQALLREAKRRRRNWYGLRDYSMTLTFLDCGLRSGELIGLELEDLDMTRHSFRVMGKGDKEREVFYGRKLSRVLREWIGKRTLSLPGNSVFCTRQGYPLGKDNINRTIKRLAARAGLEGVRCSAHTLRHTFATSFIRNGGDPFALQRLLGHSDIQTTMIYVHLAGTTLKEAHAKASPVDRLLT